MPGLVLAQARARQASGIEKGDDKTRPSLRLGIGQCAAVSSLRVAEFFLQPPDKVCDEIAISPADAVGHLLHLR